MKSPKSKKGHNSEKMHFELSPLIIWISLWIVNTYSEFQVHIFCNNRDITKCQKFSQNSNGNAVALKTAKLTRADTNPASSLTKTSILYTDGHTDGQTE